MKSSKQDKHAFAEKLARLRREKPNRPAKPAQGKSPALPHAELEPVTVPNTSAPGGIPIWVRKRLQGRRDSPRAMAAANPTAAPCDVPRLMGRPDELQIAQDGSYWFRRRVYQQDYVHGEWPLDKALGVSNTNFVLLSGDGELASLDPSRAVYLDTETTGLSGGAGVFVYMVGLATFVEGGLEVWQGFMDGPEQEAALLTEVARRIAGSGGVVSFFGKSFDRHRLQDKMSVHGIASPFDELPHLDLYHPLRRLHRGVYENSRLQTMEKALCGLKRSDDLPGSLAPEAWFDYLGERPHRLEGVFRHNCDDVLSLVTLLAWLAEVDQRGYGQDSLKEESARELALCEALAGNKDFDRALLRLEPFIERFGSQAPSIDGPARLNIELAALMLLRGECLRRLHRGQEALQCLLPLLSMADVSVWGVRAKGLAAKVLERQQADFPAAHAMCLAAQEDLAGLRPFQGRPALERDVAKRTARLAKKLAGVDP